MTAIVEPIISSQDAPPACLAHRFENSHRLVSLLDIVKQFTLIDAAFFLVQLQSYETMMTAKIDGGYGGSPAAKVIPDIRKLFKDLSAFSESNSFLNCYGVSDLAVGHLDLYPKSDISSVQSEVRHIKAAFMRDMDEHRFLRIAKDRTSMVDNAALFGTRVHAAFPSARFDIRESGNCLATECSTAAVFHLMRAAEYALRALAIDRRIKLARNATLDLASWEEIIRALEHAETAIQNYPKTVAREAQFEFYHGAMMEFKRFKNKFRNRIMHTRDEYNRTEAHSVFVHVRDFMQILSSRISENTKTPVIWQGPKWATIEP